MDEVAVDEQVITCPPDWLDRYMKYIQDHQIPCREIPFCKTVGLVIPRKYRPHAWKL